MSRAVAFGKRRPEDWNFDHSSSALASAIYMLGNANCITTQDLEHRSLYLPEIRLLRLLQWRGGCEGANHISCIHWFPIFSHAQDALLNMRVSAHDIQIHKSMDINFSSGFAP